MDASVTSKYYAVDTASNPWAEYSIPMTITRSTIQLANASAEAIQNLQWVIDEPPTIEDSVRRTLPYNPNWEAQRDADFTASLSGKNIQLVNTATGMYTIYVQDAPISRGNGMRMVGDTNLDTNMMSFWSYTTPNDRAQAPDDSVWLVNDIAGSDGMMRLTNTFNTDFIWGNGITPSGVNGHMDYWHNNQSHPSWAAQTGGQDYGGAAEVNPSMGMILEQVDGINQYMVNFPAQDGEAQYLLMIQPTTSSGMAFLCRKSKMAYFTFDTNNLLTGTNEERAYKLATMTLNVVVPPIQSSVLN